MNKSQSFKLFKLKKWLKLPEVATHLSGVCKQEVSEADILRMALNNHLKLSVYFVNKAYIIYCGEGASHKNFPLKVQDKAIEITGLWDLPMLGNGRLDIEDRYQSLTGGPKVSWESYVGGVYYVANSFGTLFRLQCRNNWSGDIRYSPADNLPIDSVLVVRTEALREFEELIADNETDKIKATKPHGNTEQNAGKREQVLGAAFAVLAKWPEQCRDKKGEPVASKIADMVDAKADLFWPDAQPPLATDSIAEHLRVWIKKVSSSRK